MLRAEEKLNKGKALVAMSGGVDSSVAAYLAREAGLEVTGVTMRLIDNELIGEDAEAQCCTLDDVQDAAEVCDLLGIKHCVFDFKDDFDKDVVQRFVKAYENGLTPNPCINCNRHIKFKRLFKTAFDMGQDYVVTGHYAKVSFDKGSGRWLLSKAEDLSKDQSYVLFSLTQEQLAHTLFPMGSMSKAEARKLAESQGFVTARKRESQDICFIPDGRYAEFIERYTGKKYPHGCFVDANGNVLGEHKGLIRYTIGQRKGLGLSLKAPMYVCRKDVDKNLVILGSNDDLFTKEFTVSDLNWIAFDGLERSIRVNARVRYSQKESPATIIPLSENKVKVIFDDAQRAITCGQAAVFYDGNVVVGGGTIVKG